MKGIFALVWLVLVVAATGCAQLPDETSVPTKPTATRTLPESGKTIVVTSTADSGPGTMRQALLNAQGGDTITFDPAVFPPSTPAAIYLTRSLPPITHGNLTIDASSVGVVLDGSAIKDEQVSGLEVTSDGNVIRGLQIISFPNAGIALRGGAQSNIVGGSRDMGSGPLGQGNLLTGNGSFGLGIWDGDTSFNTITGNSIGTDLSGTAALGSRRDGVHINGASHNEVINNLISGNGQSGAYICCKGEGNTIKHNYIGTQVDGDKPLPNLLNGVWIDQGAHHNVIGPGNTIAHNKGYGVHVRGSNSIGNRIMQNSVYDNEKAGIYQRDGGNAELAAPVIFDFDLATGMVGGSACANCAVEVFSDDGSQGRIYEGETETDALGVFAFSKGSPLAGPRLKATVSDSESNTSEFSAPTSGTRKVLTLQQGNHLPKSRIQTKRSKELVDNRIALYFHNLWQLNDLRSILDTEISSLGVKGVRLAVNELDSPMVDWSKPEFFVDPTHDDFVTRLVENGVTVTYILTFWDKVNHPGGVGLDYPRFKTEDQIERYLDFVRFIVRHFKDRVQYYALWNEPNWEGGKIQWIEAADYINLVKRVVPVIKQEHPAAKIVIGEVAGMPDIGRDYLFTILRSDAMPLVDTISWHPMLVGESPEYQSQYYYEYPSIVQQIKDEASANGFKGEYWATELNWRSPEAFWLPPGNRLYSTVVSAKYYARGIVMHLGMDAAVGLGGMSSLLPVSFPTVQNLSTVMAGAKPVRQAVVIESEPTNLRHYSFSLPNGDRLLALWTDGVAVDDDPGIRATVKLPGFSARRVTGIDAVNGFEQELAASSEGGSWVIRNLLVKDYPIILLLEDFSVP